MRTFRLVREDDVTGYSGTGVVCEGVEFSSGVAVIHWIVGDYRTTTIHPDGVRSVVSIHGHGGATRLVFDGPNDSKATWPNVPPGTEPINAPATEGTSVYEA